MRGARTPLARSLPVLAAIFTVLLLAGPNTGATSITRSTVKAPYHGVAQPTTSKVITGCGRVHVGTSSFFDLRSGMGGFSGSAATKFCRSGTSGQHSLNFGLAADATRISIRLPPFSGSHLIVARLTLAANGSGTVVPGKCAIPGPNLSTACNETAFWDAGVNGGEVVAAMGNGYWYSNTTTGAFSNWTGVEEVCTSAGCVQNTSLTSGGTPPGVVNVSVVVNVTGAYASQVYYLDLSLYADAGVSCSSSTGTVFGCAAHARVVFSGAGYGVTLTSVRVF